MYIIRQQMCQYKILFTISFFEICLMAIEVELLTSHPPSLTPPLYNVFLLSLAVNIMSRCSHKSQVHEN